jgi:hypothetical protein
LRAEQAACGGHAAAGLTARMTAEYKPGAASFMKVTGAPVLLVFAKVTDAPVLPLRRSLTAS